MVQLLQIIAMILRARVSLVTLLTIVFATKGVDTRVPHTAESDDLAYARGLDTRGDRATGGSATTADA